MGGGISDLRVVAFFRSLPDSTRHRAFRPEHAGMRDRVGEEQEERVLGLTDETLGARGVEFDIVGLAAVELVSLQLDLFFLVVNEERIPEMAVLVTGRAVEDIEAFVQHVLRVLRVAGDAGLADHGSAVAGALQQRRHR